MDRTNRFDILRGDNARNLGSAVTRLDGSVTNFLELQRFAKILCSKAASIESLLFWALLKPHTAELSPEDIASYRALLENAMAGLQLAQDAVSKLGGE